GINMTTLNRRLRPRESMNRNLLIVAALLFALCPAAAVRVSSQTPARPKHAERHEPEERDDSEERAKPVERSEPEERADFFDRAEDEEDLNRELWEYVKGTPYERALIYVAAAQARAQTARVAEAALPNGWTLAPAGRQVELGR